jgi:RNA polymerase sigma factor (TIGR02999 family)
MDVTSILESMGQGDLEAAEKLLPLVYDELRKIAAYKMAQESPGHTLQPTALVNEAWLRLVGGSQLNIQSRAQFFSVCAEAMRRILVEAARRRRAIKRGGSLERAEFVEADIAFSGPTEDVIAVDDALEQFAKEDPTAAELVKLRYFVGMNMPEAADALGLSLRSAERLWTYARAWLRRHIGSAPP